MSKFTPPPPYNPNLTEEQYHAAVEASNWANREFKKMREEKTKEHFEPFHTKMTAEMSECQLTPDIIVDRETKCFIENRDRELTRLNKFIRNIVTFCMKKSR